MLGAAFLLIAWEVIALAFFSGRAAMPPPSDVLRELWRDRSLYPPNLAATAREAGWGYLWGNLVAIALAIVFVQLPLVEGVLMRVAITAYSMPIIAIGPILQIVLSGDRPKIAIAALIVFFPTMIAALSGLRSADPTSIDLVRAYGGGCWTVLVKVRLCAALPSLLAGLRIAAPTAVLGAIIGEYFGADQGMGVAMVNAQAMLDAPRTWGIALVATALAGAAYAAVWALGRVLLPWEKEVSL